MSDFKLSTSYIVSDKVYPSMAHILPFLERIESIIKGLGLESYITPTINQYYESTLSGYFFYIPLRSNFYDNIDDINNDVEDVASRLKTTIVDIDDIRSFPTVEDIVQNSEEINGENIIYFIDGSSYNLLTKELTEPDINTMRLSPVSYSPILAQSPGSDNFRGSPMSLVSDLVSPFATLRFSPRSGSPRSQLSGSGGSSRSLSPSLSNRRSVESLSPSLSNNNRSNVRSIESNRGDDRRVTITLTLGELRNIIRDEVEKVI
ncbi:Hypothetical protein ORPV_808 [Orpheovirus IHUMI-LCC2]|uniref:Uncharacterized protein n=1 Tax=Orpheovirus IHUMI-LCC2 TaxID=2023057 RepID=A0A2I2L587_9VIRU|nr:Hypothetical protein ORPV_808 [Orpheovirus IHUMI-LCC2]SNW62712.1 Hypothetical protein ORPV_808 [Orpheovirus IHUMI-LCC2]